MFKLFLKILCKILKNGYHITRRSGKVNNYSGGVNQQWETLRIALKNI